MSGHGHVYPNPDGSKARCGGPGLCMECSLEADQKKLEDLDAVPAPTPERPTTEEGEEELAEKYARGTHAPFFNRHQDHRAGYLGGLREGKRLGFEEAYAKCPNEEWECTKIQRRLEAQLASAQAEVSRLRELVEVAEWALVEAREVVLWSVDTRSAQAKDRIDVAIGRLRSGKDGGKKDG